MDLAYVSATEALAGYASATFTPLDVLDAIAGRIERHNGRINAFSEVLLDTAYDQARASTERWSKGVALPLDGVVVAVKEEQPMRGRRLEEGSLTQRGVFADVTHPVVSRLFEAGAVIVGRTTTPEFSCAFFTHSELWGTTRNPWNLDYSPGGSSGGSAAALAAGFTTLATGSDIAGSIRVPAAMCGVVGLKPTYGQVAGLPPFTLDTYCHDGPMARTVADAELLAEVLTGGSSKDAVAWGGRLSVGGGQSLRVPGLRVGVSTNLGDYPVDVEVAAHTVAAGERLAQAGVDVVPVEVPWQWREITQTAWIHYGHIFAASMAEIVDAYPDDVMPYTARFVERGRAAAAASSFFEGLVRESQVHDDLAQLFDDIDVLVCPTVAHTGLEAGNDYVEGRVRIGHDEYDPWDVAMTLPFSIASRCPVLNVPVGIASNGVPTGVQIVGPPYRDANVWRVGRVLEQPFVAPASPA